MGEFSANEDADGLVLYLADAPSLTRVSMSAMLWRQNPISFSSFSFSSKVSETVIYGWATDLTSSFFPLMATKLFSLKSSR